MIEIGLEPRVCECCGSDDLDPVWYNQSIVKKATSRYLFRVRVVECRQCGFCFNSPCPTGCDLKRYYADGLSGCKEISLPYSIERRISVLERYSAPSGVFVEIGGDCPEEFHRRLTGLFETMQNVEVSEDIPADYRSVEELPTNLVDVIAHYDVLEHVPNVKDFLAKCHRVLKGGGVMVCEVPDLRLYPRTLAFNDFEHVNHFSVTTLSAIAYACGFRLVEVGHPSSRSFGFSAVFRKDSPNCPPLADLPFEYLNALACAQAGAEEMQRVFDHIKSLQERIVELGNRGKKITLWGVTELLRLFLKNYRLPDTAIVLDSDPRRKTHLESEGIPVFLPKDCRAHIVQSKLLAVFAPRYKKEILEWVMRETGKSFDMAEVAVIGSGPAGETLI